MPTTPTRIRTELGAKPPLTTEGISRALGVVVTDPTRREALARSLERDFVGTVTAEFAVSDHDRRGLERLARERPESQAMLSDTVARLLRAGVEPIVTLPGPELGKVTVKGGVTKGAKGDWEITLTVEVSC